MDEKKVTSEMTEEEMREQISLLTRRIFELERAVDKHGIERVNIYETPQVQNELYSSGQSEHVYKSNSGDSVYVADVGKDVYTTDKAGEVYRSDAGDGVYKADMKREVYAKVADNPSGVLRKRKTEDTYSAHAGGDTDKLQGDGCKEMLQKGSDKADNTPDIVMDLFQEPYVFSSNREKAEKESERNASEDNIRLEKTIGKNIMLIAASVLVFIGVVLSAIVIIPEMNDTIRQVMIYVAGMIIAGVGAYKYKKNPDNMWFLGLWACGMGVIFIAILVSHIYFESFNELTLYVLLAIWSAIVAVISKRTGLVFLIINQLGIAIAVTMGAAKVLDDGNEEKLLLLFAYAIITELINLVLLLKKEYGKNLVTIIGFVYNLLFINIAMIVKLDGLSTPCSVALFILVIIADIVPIAMSLFYHDVGEKDAMVSALVDCIMFAVSYISVWNVCGMEKIWAALLVYSLVCIALTDLCILRRNGEKKLIKETAEDIIWKCFPGLGILAAPAFSGLSQAGILMAGIAVVFYIFGRKNHSYFDEIFGKLCFVVALFLPMNVAVRFAVALLVFILSDILEKEEDVAKIIWKIFPGIGVLAGAVLIENSSEVNSVAGYLLLGVAVAAYIYSQIIPSVFNKYFAEVCFTLSLTFDMTLPVVFAGALIMLAITDYFDRQEHLSKMIWKVIPSLAMLGTMLETEWTCRYLLIFAFAAAFIACGFAFGSKYNRCQGLLWYGALIYVETPELLLLFFGILLTALVLVSENRFKEQYHVFDKVAVYLITMFVVWYSVLNLINDIPGWSWEACDFIVLIVLSVANVAFLALPLMRRSSVSGKNELAVVIVFYIFNCILTVMSLNGMQNDGGIKYAFLIMAVTLCMITSVMMSRQRLMVGTIHSAVKFLLLLIYSMLVFDAPDYVLSVVLMIYALIVVVVGFALERKLSTSLSKLRIPALILTLLCIVKLLALDFSYDSNLLRAVSYLFAGVLCFVISFIYTKLDKKLAKTEL